MGTNGIIKPMAVEIKALMMDGEWVTLRGFQQLPKEDLIDPESGQLKGVPWGRVNFDPGDCTTEAEHLHVVWQKGSQLRRDCVKEGCCSPLKMYEEKADAECRRLAQAVLDGRVTELSGYHRVILDFDERLKTILSSYLSHESTLRCQFRHAPPESSSYSLPEIKKYVEIYERNVEESHEQLKRYTEERPYRAGSVEQVLRAMDEFKNSWRESYAAVASTEQLFIAD